jgi:hypothetical protein
MDLQDIKLVAINSISLAISMTQVEVALKILLLVVSIGYTMQKWYEVYRKNNNK